jgi:hypothetical protein
MAQGRIRVGPPPSQDRSTIDNQVASANEPTADGGQDAEDEESFRQGGPCALPALALLRGGVSRCNVHELRNEIMEELTAEGRVKSEEAFGAL